MRSKPTVRVLALVFAASAVATPGCDSGYRRHRRYREEEFRARCGQYIDRIETDRQKLADLEPGRHEKARDWFEDDMRDARRDLDRCRDSLD